MNKEYVYHDGEVFLQTENENIGPIEYRDNLDGILVLENVIETTEKELKDLEEESKKFNKNRKSKKSDIFAPFITGFLGPIICSVLFYSFGMFDAEPFSAMFANTTMTGGMFYSISMTALGSFVGGVFSLINYCDYKVKFKEENARKASIEYLKNSLEKAKENLNEMNNKKIEANKKKGFRIVKINDSEEMRKIYGNIKLYHDCGYNGPRYYRYYQKHNKLPRKLENNCSELEKELIKEYLEEKGPSLVKRRTTNKNR